MKNKSASSTLSAFETIVSEGRKPKKLRSDYGSEFKNSLLQKYLKQNHITQIISGSISKAAYAERVIRTLTSMMYRYFSHNQTHRYIDILPSLVYNYNHSVHSALNGLSSAEVNEENEAQLWKYMYMDEKPKTIKVEGKSKPVKKFKFTVGDLVRITQLRHAFKKDYEEKWSHEVFRIWRRFWRQNIPVYKITDYNSDPIEGSFYESELQKAHKDPDVLWKVEKILKRRIRRGIPEVYVKWYQWPKKFNSWIPESDLKDI